MLASSGCAALSEITPQEWVVGPQEQMEQPLKEAQAEEAALALPSQEITPQAASPSQPAEEVKTHETRPPLTEILLAALKSSKSDKQPQKYVVKPGDALSKIADKNHVTLTMLKLANRLETNRINVGQKLIIPAAALRIEIDKSENRLRLFNKSRLVRSYPVATGNQGVTPVGTYTVATRLIQPTWYWQGIAVKPDDPDYPLGTRWLGLSKRGYGIHGTNEPDSIGKQLSHGCIRMFNEDVEDLFEVIAVGTAVKIVD